MKSYKINFLFYSLYWMFEIHVDTFNGENIDRIFFQLYKYVYVVFFPAAIYVNQFQSSISIKLFILASCQYLQNPNGHVS